MAPTVTEFLYDLDHPLKPAIALLRATILGLFLLGCASAEEGLPPSCADPAPWRALLASHLARYPDMQTADALKLLQQATTGSEHAVNDSTAAAAWMQREWDSMGEGPIEPVFDTLGGRFARVHLRSFKEAGGDPASLTAAFVATSHTAPDTTLLGCALSAVAGVVPWDAASWRAEVERWRAAGFPAMHHSEAYAERYRPAYRVVGVTTAPVPTRTEP